MKINVHLPGQHGWVQGTNAEVTTTELVELWRSGKLVAAQPKEAKGQAKPPLHMADVAFVEINLALLPIGYVLAHPFTQQFLTAAAYTDVTSNAAARCVLAFKLSKTAINGRHLSMVMKGLETLYAGSVSHADVLQGFGGAGLTNFFIPDGALSAEGEKVLATLGQESRSFNTIQYKQNPPRSRLHLELDTVVRWGMVAADAEGSNETTLAHIPAGTKVFCPVHADALPTAVVLRGKDGAPAVVCSHCKRTYGLDRSRRYDFDFSQQVFKELAAEEAADEGSNQRFIFTQTPYLPAVPFQFGITCIQSGKGTGKTTQLVELVKECKARNLRVLLIGHRRTLLQSLAEKLGLTNYFTIVDDGGGLSDADEHDNVRIDLFNDEQGESAAAGSVDVAGVVRNDPTDHYAVSLDSLVALTPDKDRYDVIIVDEPEQVFTHLISKTLREKRSQVYLRLRHYLRVAQAVYLLDADLNMVTMDTLFQAGIKADTPVRVIINEPVARGEPTYLYDSDKQLVARFMAAVTAGEKCFVATNSIKEAKRLAEVAAKSKADARIVCIHAENSQSPQMQKLIGNISAEFEQNIDVLIASPALGTGVDISFRDAAGKPRSVVQKVFGFFMRNITTHFDIVQAVMRVREPGEVHIWVDAWQHQFECDPAILRSMLESSVKDSHRLIGYEDDGTPVFAADDGLVDVWARIAAASLGSKNDLAELYKGLRRRNGHTLVQVGYDEAAKASGQASMTSARETLRAEREAALLAADIIDGQTAKKLTEQDTNGGTISEDERLQLERYRIEKFHHEAISAELIAFDDDGRIREKVRNLECLLEPVARLTKQDDEEQKLLLPFDRRLRLLRRKLLANLLGAAGIFDQKAGIFSASVAVDQQGLARFVELAVGYRKRLELVFGLVLRRDVRTKPVLQLREVLALAGLTLGDAEVKEIAGRKVRRYRLDDERLQALLALVARREEDRQKWDEAEADKSDDQGITKKDLDLSSGNKAVGRSDGAVSAGDGIGLSNLFKHEARRAAVSADTPSVTGPQAVALMRLKKAAAGMKSTAEVFCVD